MYMYLESNQNSLGKTSATYAEFPIQRMVSRSPHQNTLGLLEGFLVAQQIDALTWPASAC